MENHGAEIFSLKVRCGKQRIFSCFIEKIFGLRKNNFLSIVGIFYTCRKVPRQI